ncbi:MAG: hypothetical protein R2932_52440 [Caldilineaceae bacterium]
MAAPLDPDTSVTTFAETHSERPLERTLQGLRMGLHRIWSGEKPLGMSDDEFYRLRQRHENGEISIGEVEHLHL